MESRTTVSIRARIGIVGLLAAVFGLGLSIPAFAAWTCSASFFCGYDEDNGVQRIYSIAGGPGDVIFLNSGDRDSTESVRNRTSRYYCGVNRQLFGDQTVVEVDPGGQFNLAASATNNIDHYDIKGAAGNCHNPP